ncbi:ABC transporter ATP-binding protein [Formosa algae]|uniref:Lipopolysaccharide transport system ATP-binding protein n=1 Tax=Formosa algae TaxID=225843 RepID=A0A9X1C9L4_9FLAO|nr:ABC transporter ATP-binding protein [Formosa algae]MBP1841351.1 lipopolysaccharide transport system ATP-binding protein [Formosa algae]MDQ0336727.1 lipopolysaccharide transport system ATP-binding protein [Formosa algae]OEI80367.1 ABC transporter ATP-binding protein [Formosa algae]
MIILKAENISKQYRLGLIGTGTISHDLNRWWHQVRGKEDPYLKIGEVNNRSTKGDSAYAWALRDINFEVQQGEVLGIIGKNGAGKSTLLKILSRVTSPSTGEIKTRGRIASLLEVGTGFHPELTGRENIYLNGAILGMTKAEIKAKEDEIIAFSGCERYVDTPVKRYSSGMRVRLAFAVAAFLEPDILVIDEVLAVGDAEFQKKAIGKMQDISQSDGRTVLFVSHNMAAVKNLCTRAIVLEHGQTVFEGDVDEAINYYLNSKEDVIAIKDIKNRKGNGVVKASEVIVYGAGKNTKPQSGQPFYIKFELENYKGYTSKDIQFDIRIDDGVGQRIAWLSTTLLDENLHNEVINTITFQIDKLNLNKGLYHCTIYIQVENTVSDWIQNAFSFEVVEGDFYGFGKIVPQNQSKLLMDFKVKYEL